MTRPLALLRPQPGWSDSAAAAQARGLDVVGHPLFAAEAVQWTLPQGEFDAILAGSGAAFRLGGPQLEAIMHLPVHAVGKATADAASDAGFAVARTGDGGLQKMVDGLRREPIRFLRLGGQERVPLAPQADQTVVDCVVYRMVPLSINPRFRAVLAKESPIVALHSAAAARHFAREIDRLGLSRGTLALLALGPRIAAAAGLGWAAVPIADRPNDAALLAKARALCK